MADRFSKGRSRNDNRREGECAGTGCSTALWRCRSDQSSAHSGEENLKSSCRWILSTGGSADQKILALIPLWKLSASRRRLGGYARETFLDGSTDHRST